VDFSGQKSLFTSLQFLKIGTHPSARLFFIKENCNLTCQEILERRQEHENDSLYYSIRLEILCYFPFQIAQFEGFPKFSE
jgi:hypothetical protein